MSRNPTTLTELARLGFADLGGTSERLGMLDAPELVPHFASAADPDQDNRAGKLALARKLGAQDEAGGLQRILSVTLEQRQRRHFSPLHLQTRLAQVQGLQDRVADALAEVSQQQKALAERLAGRLWLPPLLARHWLAAHGQTLATLQGYGQRLQASHDGFAALPQDPQLNGPPPQPVPLD